MGQDFPRIRELVMGWWCSCCHICQSSVWTSCCLKSAKAAGASLWKGGGAICTFPWCSGSLDLTGIYPKATCWLLSNCFLGANFVQTVFHELFQPCLLGKVATMHWLFLSSLGEEHRPLLASCTTLTTTLIITAETDDQIVKESLRREQEGSNVCLEETIYCLGKVCVSVGMHAPTSLTHLFWSHTN